MPLRFLLLAICVSAQPFGSLSISTLSIFPSATNTQSAQFSLSLTPEFAIPAQETMIRITSPYEFITRASRTDCFLYDLPDVFVKTCDSKSHELNVTIIGLQDADLTGPVNLKVLQAFNLPSHNVSSPFEVETSWSGEVMNRNSSVPTVFLHSPGYQFSGLKMVLMNAMKNAFTVFKVSFVLDITITQLTQLVLQFPEGFDPAIGKINAETLTMACTCSPAGLSPSCLWAYSSVVITVSSPISPYTLVEINITSVRMPENVTDTPVQLLLVKESTVLAMANVVPKIEQHDLNLECCIEYDRLTVNCTDVELLAVCADFHFNIAQFTKDMNAIRVLFKQMMDISPFRKLGKAGENCNILLEPKTVRLLGNEPICRWAESDELVIYLGAYPMIQNTMLYFLPDTLLAKSSGKPFYPPRLRVLYPKLMPVPNAVITTVGLVSKCGEATADCWKTTGTGRRNLNCRWYVDGVFVMSGPRLSLVYANEEHQTTRKIRLEAINEWGRMGVATGEVQVDPFSDLQVSFPFGSFVQFYYASAFTVYPSIALSKCAQAHGANMTLTKLWHSNSTMIQEMCQESQHFCTIPQRTVPVGFYSLALMVDAPTADFRFRGWVNATLSIALTKMQIIVLGGNRTLSIDQALFLDGSMTLDPDVKEDRKKVMLIWTLQDSNLKEDENYKSVYGYSFTLPKNYLEPKKTYYVKVQTPKLEFRDSVSDIVWIETTKAPTWTISIIPPQKKNPTDIVTINPVVYMNFYSADSYCFWNQTTNHNYQPLSYITVPILVFAPESLDSGMVYIFEYICNSTLPTGEVSLSKAQVTIHINEVPTGGVFDTSPSQGIEMQTEFTLIARNWVDNDGDLPLRYQYYHKINNATYVPFTAKMLQTSMRTKLAKFESGSDYESIYLYVCDALDACTRILQTISLISSEDIAQIQINQVLASIDSVRATTNDPRAAATSIGQLCTYIGRKMTAGQLNSTEVTAYMSTVNNYIRQSADFLKTEVVGGIATEDQETLVSLVMSTMIPGGISNSLIADSIDILSKVVNLTETRYTTGPIYVMALSSMQESIDLTIGEDGSANEDQIKVADSVHTFAKNVVRQIVDRLTPGQFPMTLVESAMSVYAVRRDSTGLKTYEIQLKVRYGDTDGYYNISMPSDYLDQYQKAGEVIVVEHVISTMKMPPADALISTLPHLLCAYSYSQNTSHSEVTFSQHCKNITLLTPGNLTTINPTFQVSNIGSYNQSTGNVADNSSRVSMAGDFVVTHSIPVANFEGEVDCVGRTKDGVLASELCREKTQRGRVLCGCMNTMEIIAQRFATAEDFIIGIQPKSDGGNADGFISLHFSGGMVLFIAVVVVFLGLIYFFHCWDRSERNDIREIQLKFEMYVEMIVDDLAHMKENVTVTRRRWASIWLCFLFFVTKEKKYSLELLFAAFNQEQKGSKPALIAGIKSALKIIRDQREAIWARNNVLESFSQLISKSIYLRMVTAQYFQFLTGNRIRPHPDPQVHPSLTCCGLPIRSCKVNTDNLIYEVNIWSIFVQNNEFVGLFFNRKPSMKRVYRVPILAVAFLGPLLKYAASFESLNSNKLTSIGTMMTANSGQFWKEAGWEAALFVAAVFAVVGTFTEKLIVLVVPTYSEVRWAAHYFPARDNSWKRYLRKYTKLALARYIPFLVCGALIAFTELYLSEMDTNDALLVLVMTLESFAQGVAFFSVIGAVFIGVYGAMRAARALEKKFGSRVKWVWLGIKDLVWVPMKNVGAEWYWALVADDID